MPRKEYICSLCSKEFFRYSSTVRNDNKVYCSRECKSNHQKELLKGSLNPNYKAGKYLETTCKCGREKDFRSIQCAICANTSFPINKEDRDNYTSKLIKAIKDNNSFLDAKYYLEKENIYISRKRLRLFQVENNVDISHFVPGKWRPTENEKLFSINFSGRNGILKKRILEEKLIPYICSECSQEPIWNNKPLVLQLDHTNGNSSDNRLENLRFLCPNCHTQTTTFCGSNIRGKNYLKENIK